MVAHMSTLASSPSSPSGLAASVRDAVKIFGKGETSVTALQGVDLDLPRGGFTAVMGPSGSGKSTLMHCMAGLDKLTSGSAEIGGDKLETLKDAALTKLRRRKVGFIFQAFNLVQTLTARENIELPLRLDGESPDPKWFDEVVGRLGIADRMDHTPTELSGGQIQRVAVARALVSRPDVIFADEPTGNLDQTSGAEVLALMRAAVDDYGQTIVMVTHDATSAAVADRVLFLFDGKIVDTIEDPSADTVFERIRSLSTGGAN
ncbi:MAG: peptide transporter ATP-binding protein [Thermoleophilia bacterium]|nr:peptide transporter ATP-binding protein [Thermoleophilia bacterium]